MLRERTARAPIRLRTAIVWLATGVCACAGEQDPTAADVHPVDAWLAPLVAADVLSGVLLVAEGDSVAYERAFGQTRYPDGSPIRPDTPVSVASVTKPMTQIILLKLVEEGRVSLADTISTWLPEFRHGRRITVEQLARHRSGIPHRVTRPDQENVARSAADMVQLASREELAFAPGEERLYSSAGYSVLARVLEVASGRSYAELLDEYVLAPVGAGGVVDASVGVPPGGAIGHFDAGSGPVPGPEKHLSFLVGAGSAFATARDLFLIARGVLNGTYGELVTSNLSTEEGEVHWNGLTNGSRAFVDYDAASDRTVVFVTNRFNGAGDLVRSQVPHVMDGDSVAVPRVPDVVAIALPETVRTRYEGAYEFGSPDDTELLEFLDPDLARLGTWLLIPIDETLFFSPQDWTEVEVELADDGAVEALKWGGEGGARFPRARPPPAN